MKHTALIMAVLLLASCSTAREPDKRQSMSPDPGGQTATQPTCPVMEGKRINRRLYVDDQGVRIYVCCTACVKAVRKCPEKYLAKLRDQTLKPTTTTEPAMAH